MIECLLEWKEPQSGQEVEPVGTLLWHASGNS